MSVVSVVVVAMVLLLLNGGREAMSGSAHATQGVPEIGKKFFFASPELMPWKEVPTFCVRPEFNDRFRVAEVRSEAEAQAALAALKLVNDITGQQLEGWLGGYRVNMKWVWPNKDKFPFLKWAKNQPSNDAANNCLAMKTSGKWWNVPCNDLRRAVCQGFAYTKAYDFVARDQLLDRNQSEVVCGSLGGTVATLGSPQDQETAHHQTNRGRTDAPTFAPTKQPKTFSPTKKPTRKKLNCCSSELNFCCMQGPRFTVFPQCATCDCCCCNPDWKPAKYAKCCHSRPKGYCGCPTNPPANLPRQGLLAELTGENDLTFDDAEFDLASDDTTSNVGSDVITNNVGLDENFVFLSARNDKVEFVKEENGSFVWSNGISFKPIGYLPINVSEQFTNWETFPLQNVNFSCAVMSTLDGKWRSAPCDIKGRGALCEFHTAKKRFEIYTSVKVNMTGAGEFCAKTFGQLASIKTTDELALAVKEYKRANKQCGKCANETWLNGKQFGQDFYWSDGQIFYRGDIPIGLGNKFENGTVGSCVTLASKTGDFARADCSELFYPMCEYRIPGDQQWIPPVVDPDACFPGCLPSFIGDGVCDPVCNHYTCNFDGDDCGQCAPGCSFDKLRNGKCDPECFNATCAFDSRDCFPDGEVSSRRLLLEGESALDEEMEMERNLKNSLPAACSQTSSKCKPKWIGDKYCDLIACGRECDAADCQGIASPTQCAKTCRQSDLYNDQCDPGCATLDCNFDGGLCPVSCDAACGSKITSNTCNKPQCDVPSCRYDISRCRDDSNPAQFCSPNCLVSMLGNGVCNQECNNQACKWDAGDCPESDFCPYPLPYDEYGCIDQCNKPLYKFQRGACENTCFTATCRPDMLGNGVCDAACNNARCGMDGGDCAPCAPGCNPFQLNDGNCDAACNLSGKCENDGGDCA